MMKPTFLFLLTSCGLTNAIAQNSAVINQQGGPSGSGHEVTVVQQGNGNSSVVNQSNPTTPVRSTGSRAVVNQSGTGNVATVNQGNGMGDSVTQSGQSVSVSQSGEGETIIDQTNGTNTIRVYQRGPASPPPSDPKKRGRTGNKRSD